MPTFCIAFYESYLSTTYSLGLWQLFHNNFCLDISLSIFSILSYASYYFILHFITYFIAGDILLCLDKIPEWLEKEGCIIGGCKQEKNTYFSRRLFFCNNRQTFLKYLSCKTCTVQYITVCKVL